MHRFMGNALPQGIIKAGTSATAAQLGQIVGSKAKHRACQHRNQRNILTWIINNLKIRQGGHNLQ